MAGPFSLASCHVPVYSVEVLLGRALLEVFAGGGARTVPISRFSFYLIGGITSMAFVGSSF